VPAVTADGAARGASITVRRRVAWNETDAAGHNHFTAVFRWIEEAEHALFRSIGADTSMIARIPRVHIEVDYFDRLYFDELIEVRVGVVKVGNSSCGFDFEVRKADGGRAIGGSYVIVHASGTASGSAPWPERVRSALSLPADASSDVLRVDVHPAVMGDVNRRVPPVTSDI
jgi:YbgC/YbaW family acyl-CoA thioester hydrolase